MNLDSPEYQRASAAHLKHIAEVVRTYNYRQSSGSRVGAHIDQEAPATTNINPVLIQLAPELELCGLTLQQVQRDDQWLIAQGEAPFIVELRADIANKTIFLNYLNAINRDTLDEDGFRALEWFANQTIEQLTSVYDLNDLLGSEFLNCITSLEAMIQKYQELDPSNERGLLSVSHKLQKYRDAANGKFLREYVSAEHHELLTDIGESFNPSLWQVDSTEEFFRQKWNETMVAIRSMGKNPNAQPFVRSMVQHLLESIAHARNDIHANEDAEFPYHDKPAKLRILDEMEGRLHRESF